MPAITAVHYKTQSPLLTLDLLPDLLLTQQVKQQATYLSNKL